MLNFKDLISGKIFKKDPADINLRIGPKRNHKFSKEFIEATKYLHKTFCEVSPSTLERWLDDFDRDAHPEKELVTWLYIAKIYNEVIKRYPEDLKVRRGVFQILLSFSTGITAKEIIQDKNFSLLKLSEKDVKSIYATYTQQQH